MDKLAVNGEDADVCSVYEDVEENHINASSVKLKEPLETNDLVATESVSALNLTQPLVEKVAVSPLKLQRTFSCPEVNGQACASGPWSLDWLKDSYDEEAGIVFSSKKKKVDLKKSKAVMSNGFGIASKKKKSGGVLQHSVLSLKKIARMPTKDRKNIMKILRKKIRKRSGRKEPRGGVSMESNHISSNDSSSMSVNNDWQHWVVMHGNEKVAVEDVWGVGKAIGVKFNGDPTNMFNMLSRAGRGKNGNGEGVQGGGNGRVV